MAVTPISADKIIAHRAQYFPDEVIGTVNQMLIRKFNMSSRRAVIPEDELVDLMVQKGLKREEIFANNWLDFEQVFGDVGWIVTYNRQHPDDPDGNFFTFTREIDR